jgi:hypothetical protein
MRKRYLTLLVLLNLIFIVVLLITNVDQLTHNAYTLKLIGRCYLDYHVPIRSVGLACPGVDYI